MLQPCSLHITGQHRTCSSHNEGKDLTMGCKGDLFSAWSPSKAAVAIVGTYSSSASEAAQISEGGSCTTAHPLCTVRGVAPLPCVVIAK